jgi:tRNA (uracil-5-)-methyltransferase TRM9
MQNGGKVLLYVWALEQKGSRRGWHEGNEQDVMVPWVRQRGTKSVKNNTERKQSSSRGTIVTPGQTDTDLNTSETRRMSERLETSDEPLSPQTLHVRGTDGLRDDAGAQLSRRATTNKDEADTQPEETTFQRYYHLYKKGELEDDIRAAGGFVIDCGYEKDNWWAVAGITADSCSGAPQET